MQPALGAGSTAYMYKQCSLAVPCKAGMVVCEKLPSLSVGGGSRRDGGTPPLGRTGGAEQQPGAAEQLNAVFSTSFLDHMQRDCKGGLKAGLQTAGLARRALLAGAGGGNLLGTCVQSGIEWPATPPADYGHVWGCDHRVTPGERNRAVQPWAALRSTRGPRSGFPWGRARGAFQIQHHRLQQKADDTPAAGATPDRVRRRRRPHGAPAACFACAGMLIPFPPPPTFIPEQVQRPHRQPGGGHAGGGSADRRHGVRAAVGNRARRGGTQQRAAARLSSQRRTGRLRCQNLPVHLSDGGGGSAGPAVCAAGCWRRRVGELAAGAVCSVRC